MLPKSFGNQQVNRIGGLRIWLKDVRVLNKKINHPRKSQSNKLSQLQHKPISNFRTPYYPRFVVGLAQVDIGNHLQPMVGSDHKNLFSLFRRMRKENRSQGSGGKQGDIRLTLKIGYF
jgi:hypothetical protein